VSAREDIAAAASTVDGIDCTAYWTGADKDGSAYVEMLRDDWPNKLGAERYYGVVVTLPTDQAQAERFLEEKAGPLAKALRRELTVTQVRPELIQIIDGPITKAMVAEGHRAAEE
jgi:hypothetical protein